MYGVPNFKLDREVVRGKADWLRLLGVSFRCGVKVGDDTLLDDLIEQEEFDAVFLGTGALIEATMDIPGESLAGVYTSIDFLVRHNTPKGALPTDYHEPLELGKRVAVIGGGDTALDCLRTAVRLGAEETTCYYRRTEAEMPANAHDHKLADQEGAKFVYLAAPVAFLDRNNDGRVDAVQMIHMELGTPDDSGRQRSVPVKGSEYIIEVDSVILSIGFWPDPLLAETTPSLAVHKYGLIVADPETGQTSRPGIFAGGDNVIGPDLVVSAAAAGIRAAKAISDYLAPCPSRLK
jgi:glutamate synthase (NADPH/NADH) small chain